MRRGVPGVAVWEFLRQCGVGCVGVDEEKEDGKGG